MRPKRTNFVIDESRMGQMRPKRAFLAHLSRRLIGELIVYEGIRRPSVRCPFFVRQHFQMTSPLKP